MSFEKIKLSKPIQKALIAEGYKTPTPIQKRAIPIVLDGKDLLGCAQTGTGKTAAFALPILEKLSANSNKGFQRRYIRSLIVTPTRELAIQISDSFKAYGKYTGLKTAVVFGGVSQKLQTDRLKKGVDILIATPGRLLDLINQNYIILNRIEMFVLDEADRMLDMGFIHDVKKVIEQLPAKRQSLFFSATMPPEIVKLARTILTKPVKVEVTPQSSTVEAIKQSIYYVDKPKKKELLIHLLKDPSISSALIFTRTKHAANNLAKVLNKVRIMSDAIHGNKSQGARQTALKNFKEKKTRVLVATDIAARGIDIDELSHVINFEIPNIAETYVHRIGRTGRAGLGGTALSLCGGEEKAYLSDINKLVSKPIHVVDDHPFVSSKGREEVSDKIVNKTSSRNQTARKNGTSFGAEERVSSHRKSNFKKKSSSSSTSKSRRRRGIPDSVWTNR
jgi:ATP-dependent RNA helicase RhlE